MSCISCAAFLSSDARIPNLVITAVVIPASPAALAAMPTKYPN